MAAQKNESAPGGMGALNKGEILARAASLAVPFVENAGQFNAEVRFSADLLSGRFFLTEGEMIYSLTTNSTGRGKNTDDKILVFSEYFAGEKGEEIHFKPLGEGKGTAKISYFNGNDPAKWQSGLDSYSCVSLGRVYPGVQVKLRAGGQNVEKVFFVGPGNDASAIRIGVRGARKLTVTKDGRLQFRIDIADLSMRAPLAWQEIAGRRHDVPVGYRLLGKRLYGFAILGECDKSYPLFIDPALDTVMASTFLGGSGGSVVQRSMSLAVDGAGNVYLTGYTSSASFPTTPAAYDRSFKGGSGYYPSDAFISKLNGNLTRLLASTYLGGRGNDEGHSLALDKAGNVYLTGCTYSADFPVTSPAYDRHYNGDSDVFISKLDGDLGKLLASTYLGGGQEDGGSSLALDSASNVVLCGDTLSTDFPTTARAYDRSFNGGEDDIFLAKLNGNLTRLLASTYLGGECKDKAKALALDSTGNAYLTGYTDSEDFPTTPGAYDRSLNGGRWRGDAYISRIDSRLTALLASTYLGGKGRDEGNSLAVGHSGDVYLTGVAESEDFPTAPGAIDRTFDGYLAHIQGEAFISRLDGALMKLPGSTFIPDCVPYSCLRGEAISLDEFDNVYVTGSIMQDTWPDNLCGIVFISKVNKVLTKLLGTSCLGEFPGLSRSLGSGKSLALDLGGAAYVTGVPTTRFPTTKGAFDRTYHGIFVTKLNGSEIGITLSSPNGGEIWTAGTNHDITWETSGAIARVKIRLSIDHGDSWSDVTAATDNDGRFTWTVPNTPSTACLVRVNDANDALVSDTSDAPFSILIGIDLAAERREIRAYSIVRQYGRIQFLVQTSSDQAAQYRVLRRKASEDFAVLKTVAPSELRDNQFQMQDKYLEKDKPYTYKVEAYNEAGQVIGRSAEKTI